MSYSNIKEVNCSPADVDKLAAKFRKFVMGKCNVNPEPTGTDVRPFLEKVVTLLGGRVSISEAPSWLEEAGGSLVIAPGRRSFEIRLSRFTSPLRDVFTIAHELGHYVLHYPHKAPLNEEVPFYRYGSGPIEAQANRFAAAFLMPADEFTRLRKEFGNDEYRLASHFGVSKPAVAARMQYIS